MAYCKELDDSDWSEVDFINTYALFMGYLSVAIKGLGFLILTWSTVVLLGGFVSMLQKKDFWCLTFITLVQTAGIFDVYLNDKLSHIAKSFMALPASALFGVTGVNRELSGLCFIVRLLLAVVVLVVQVVVCIMLLGNLAAIYVFGLLISTGISIWRLKHQDYGGNSDSEANLKPAMNTLYYLALLQGLFFCYQLLFSRARKGLVEAVETHCDKDKRAVLTYLRETRIGCEKDPSFARGRNLITHAVDLIGSKSRDDFLSGVEMLDMAIHMAERRLRKAKVEGKKNLCATIWKEIIGRHMMMKNLIISASSSPVLQKLLQTLDPRGAFDRETRNQGATIVSHLALDIHLEQFPQAIQYICSLIGNFEEYRLIEPHNRNRLLNKFPEYWDGGHFRHRPRKPDIGTLREAYDKLVLTGLCILRKLATHENNCRIMSHTQGLLPRIMAPLTSDMIHQFNGGAWSIMVVEESLKVMFLLVAAPGETGAQLRREISSNKEAISTMERILNCPDCHINMQKRAMGILIDLYMDTKARETYVKKLVEIFTDDNKDRSIRKLAGEALAKLSIQGGRNISIILQANSDVVRTLTKILLLDDAENNTCRIRAAEILEQMCIHHTQDDESLCRLKKYMIYAMPKVLARILGYRLTKDETHLLAEADQVKFIENETDIENQCDIPQDNAREESSSYFHPQCEGEVDMEVDELDNDKDKEFRARLFCKKLYNDADKEVRAPLLSLFVTVCDIFISADEDLACQFDAMDASSLPKKLKELVAANSVPKVRCLRLTKLTCKMVISMMKHRCSYEKKELESLTEALLRASESMSHLDMSMVFTSAEDGAVMTINPVRSLISLLKEAKESVDTYFKAQ